MNGSPALTIFFFQWRRARWLLVSIAACLVCVSGALYLVDRNGLRPSAGEPSQDFIITLLFIGVSVAASIATVLFVHSDTDRIHVSLPPRILRLPLATWKLVAVVMLFGALSVGGMSLGATAVMKAVLGGDYPWWMPPTVSLLIIAALQAWTLVHGEGNPKVAFASLGLIALLAIGVAKVEWVFDFFVKGSFFAMASTVAVGFTVLYAVAFLGLRLNRSGGLADWSSSHLDWDRGAPIARRFRSPAEAQRWYEWRLFGWQLPAAATGVLVLYFVMMPLVVAVFRVTDVTGKSSTEPLFFVSWLTSAQYVTTGIQVASLVGGVLVGGFMFMKAGQWNDQSNFLLTRPLSTRALAQARIAMATSTVLFTLAILMGALLGMYIVLTIMGESMAMIHFLKRGYDPYPDMAVLSFFWGSIFLAMWVAVWSTNFALTLGVFSVVLGGPVAAAWILNAVGAYPLSNFQEDTATLRAVCTSIVAAVLLGGVVFMAKQSASLKLASKAVVYSLPILWLLYWIPFYIFGSSMHMPLSWDPSTGMYVTTAQPWATPFPHPIDWPLWVAVSALPIAPFVCHPYLLERARHR